MTSKSILIVDDEAHMRRVTELSLRQEGYRLLSAANGVLAVAVATAEQPDLIVMDLMMPELDGLGALRQLKANEATSHIPVILLTARGQVLLHQEAEKSGAALFLTKPFSPTQLRSAVARLLQPSPPAA